MWRQQREGGGLVGKQEKKGVCAADREEGGTVTNGAGQRGTYSR